MDKKPMQKKEARLRRARRARAHILELRAFRLTVHRTPSHIYAQIIAPEGGKVVVAASTLEAEVKKGLKHCGNVTAAQAVGKAIADKAEIRGTPGFTINGYFVSGAQPFPQFDKLIKLALKEAK